MWTPGLRLHYRTTAIAGGGAKTEHGSTESSRIPDHQKDKRDLDAQKQEDKDNKRRRLIYSDGVELQPAVLNDSSSHH